MSPRMPGFTIASIKKNPALVPLYACVIAGGAIAFGYLFRLATASPEVTWHSKKNPEPYERYRHKDYKLYKFPGMPEPDPDPVPKY